MLRRPFPPEQWGLTPLSHSITPDAKGRPRCVARPEIAQLELGPFALDLAIRFLIAVLEHAHQFFALACEVSDVLRRNPRPLLEIPGATIERVGEGIQVTFASGLLYDFDSDAIRSEAGLNLRNLATSLKKYANTELLIVGHTDALGSSAYNQDLSCRRANSASAYLTVQGVGSGRVHSPGRGELEPLGSNETEAGRQTNRRIEVAIFSGATK